MMKGDLVRHKRYGVGVIVDIKEVYSSWGYPNTWYKVAFARADDKSGPRWMSKNNLETLDESG